MDQSPVGSDQFESPLESFESVLDAFESPDSAFDEPEHASLSLEDESEQATSHDHNKVAASESARQTSRFNRKTNRSAAVPRNRMRSSNGQSRVSAAGCESSSDELESISIHNMSRIEVSQPLRTRLDEVQYKHVRLHPHLVAFCLQIISREMGQMGLECDGQPELCDHYS